MQQRRLAPSAALVHAPTPPPTATSTDLISPITAAVAPYLRCHNARVQRMWRLAGLAPSSACAVRQTVRLGAAARGPARAAAAAAAAAVVTSPLAVISVLARCVRRHTRGKVFKLNLEGREAEERQDAAFYLRRILLMTC